MKRPRVVVAEDSLEMQEKIKALIGVGYDIVRSVVDGKQSLDAVLELTPDILVTDISMPLLNGIEVASRLRDLGSCTKVIFVTVHDDEEFLEAAFSLGALGYVLKARIDTDLILAMQAALKGQRFASHTPARPILAE